MLCRLPSRNAAKDDCLDRRIAAQAIGTVDAAGDISGGKETRNRLVAGADHLGRRHRTTRPLHCDRFAPRANSVQLVLCPCQFLRG
jgi:hypothetical protein